MSKRASSLTVGVFVISSVLSHPSKNLKLWMNQCYSSVLLGKTKDSTLWSQTQKTKRREASILLLLLLSRFSHVRLCVTPETAAHRASPSLGFSRQEHWSGLPFPSPMHKGEKWRWSRSVVSDPQRPHRLQPSRLLRPWDFPGKSTGVGSHCLLRALWQ